MDPKRNSIGRHKPSPHIEKKINSDRVSIQSTLEKLTNSKIKEDAKVDSVTTPREQTQTKDTNYLKPNNYAKMIRSSKKAAKPVNEPRDNILTKSLEAKWRSNTKDMSMTKGSRGVAKSTYLVNSQKPNKSKKSKHSASVERTLVPGRYLTNMKRNKNKSKLTINKPVEVNLFLDGSEVSEERQPRPLFNINNSMNPETSKTTEDIDIKQENAAETHKGSFNKSIEKSESKNKPSDGLTKTDNKKRSNFTSIEQNTHPNMQSKSITKIDLSRANEENAEEINTTNPLKPFLSKVEPKTARADYSTSKSQFYDYFSPMSRFSKKFAPLSSQMLQDLQNRESQKERLLLKNTKKLFEAYEIYNPEDICNRV